VTCPARRSAPFSSVRAAVSACCARFHSAAGEGHRLVQPLARPLDARLDRLRRAPQVLPAGLRVGAQQHLHRLPDGPDAVRDDVHAGADGGERVAHLLRRLRQLLGRQAGALGDHPHLVGLAHRPVQPEPAEPLGAQQREGLLRPRQLRLGVGGVHPGRPGRLHGGLGGGDGVPGGGEARRKLVEGRLQPRHPRREPLGEPVQVPGDLLQPLGGRHERAAGRVVLGGRPLPVVEIVRVQDGDVGHGGGVGGLRETGELPPDGRGGARVQILEHGDAPVEELLRLVHVVEGGGGRLARLDRRVGGLTAPAAPPLVARSPQRRLPSSSCPVSRSPGVLA
jgi:hypothetical protein